MSPDTDEPDVTPNRKDVMPETYAVYVTDEYVHVWQYRITLSERTEEWHFVETLDRDDGPRLSLSYVTPMEPASEGYWLYSKSYDCELTCT